MNRGGNMKKILATLGLFAFNSAYAEVVSAKICFDPGARNNEKELTKAAKNNATSMIATEGNLCKRMDLKNGNEASLVLTNTSIISLYCGDNINEDAGIFHEGVVATMINYKKKIFKLGTGKFTEMHFLVIENKMFWTVTAVCGYSKK